MALLYKTKTEKLPPAATRKPKAKKPDKNSRQESKTSSVGNGKTPSGDRNDSSSDGEDDETDDAYIVQPSLIASFAGKNIRHWRAALGASQEELSDLSGVEIEDIIGYEDGVINPRISALCKIAKALADKEQALIDSGVKLFKKRTGARQAVYDGVDLTALVSNEHNMRAVIAEVYDDECYRIAAWSAALFFGRNIRDWRARVGMSKRELVYATFIGFRYSPSVICQIEEGRLPPRIDVIAKIAKALREKDPTQFADLSPKVEYEGVDVTPIVENEKNLKAIIAEVSEMKYFEFANTQN
jgi:transcriptional regulator with XRE-family HTH domain